MSKRRAFGKSSSFPKTDPAIEDEILEAYTAVLGASPDLLLRHMPALFKLLKIHPCFSKDVTSCIAYYYNHMHGKGPLDASVHRQYIAHCMLMDYTITTGNDIYDIIDIDKLIVQVNRLVKFRNAYPHIYTSWKLFVDAAEPECAHPEEYQLTFVGLKSIKTALDLDLESVTDSFLIDMLGCAAGDGVKNYDLNRVKAGTAVSIKDFAEVLGQLDELG